ncbi:hypothetical protein NESM_000804200 [Novymonas esmeraldas]|uniref:Uncharacterized protein n=1 Tax=Novymonas esmeraldas TaxID=1808958 RepID=A0AAW0EY40_9TRYP
MAVLLGGGAARRRRRRCWPCHVFAVPLPTVVLLPLLVLCMLLCVGAPARAAMTFSTANVQQASLFQTVQLDLQSNPLAQDPSITTGDLLFFVPSTNTALCVYSGTPTASTPGYYAVTAIGSGGYAGQLLFAVSSTVFSAGTMYYPCYLSRSGQTATIMRRGFVAPGASDTLTIWSAIYTSFSMNPASANGGEGPVSLSIVQAAQTGRSLNQGLTGSYTILLVPCGSVVVGGTTVQSNCADLNALVSSCAAVGAASTTPTGVVALSGLQGQATGTVSGSFVVPYLPNTAGYYMCVPYCYSTTAGCGGATTAMSFTVVTSASSTVSSTYTLTFGSADPGVYTRTPTQPQARENGMLSFSGAGLSAQDTVKVVRSSDVCTSSTAALLPNLELGTPQVTTVPGGATTVQVSFLAPDLVTVQAVGRVCYQRAASGLWSSAYLSSTNQAADFTVDVLQPTGFTITSPTPTNPAVGETLTLSFQGSGLDGSVDAAYLSSSDDSNPCNRDGTGGGGASSGGGGSGSAALQRNTYFTCTMQGSSTTTPTCVVTVDPEDTNLAMTLSVCYLKRSASSQQTNYAEISGTLALQARNPTYTVTPYPLYAGQSGQLVFSGVGLSANDAVQLVGPTGTCGDSSATLTTATISSMTEVSPGTTYQYTIVGVAETCIKMCYRQLGSSTWVVARAADGRSAVSSSCAASNAYIASFPVRYTITNLATTGTVGSLLSVGETATVRFTAASGQAFTSSTTPTALKVVQQPDSCVTAPCGTALLAACATAQAAADYTGTVAGSGGVAFTASLQASAAEVRYIVCVATSGGSAAYVPVLPSSQMAATSTAFGFTTAVQNPTLASHSPSTWRVAMNRLSTTFTGVSLNAGTNVVYAVAASALLASYTTADGTQVAVCPPVAQTPTTVLVSSMDTGSSTASSTTVTYTRADRLYDGAVVYLCYSWSAGNMDAHVTMAGFVAVSAAIPSSFDWQTPSDTSGLRASQPVALRFISNVTSLSATSDVVYFYRYVQSANPNPNCYCDPTACATGTRVDYSSNVSMTAATTGAITDDTTILTAPLGFSNYDYSAVYIICYATFGQSADTYMGRVEVDMANPTYYTVSSVAASANRVGAPVTITAIRRCRTNACALTLQDSLLLIPSNVQCSAVPADSTAAAALVNGIVESIGDPVLSVDALSLSRVFVVDVMGTYRVCYRLASATTYSDVVFSAAYTRSVLTVVTANPQVATPVPSAPSAGQFVVMHLDCGTTTLCGTCMTVRLVPGVQASCWTEVAGTYSSNSCLSTTAVQFPEEYFVAGSYTVCYGSSYTTSRRIPGTLTVAAANPSSYAPTATSGYAVYTNQGTDYVLDITGTGLTVADTVFLLPDMGYSCHELRTGAVQGNGQLASWLEPSVSPYPLQLTSTGVSWVVSNHGKRFGIGVLSNTTLCPGNGAPCLLKLCYMRSGTSWAPVTLLAASSAPSGIELVASNPSSIEFDSYPLAIDVYVMATVQGVGLLATDVVTIHSGDCTGAAVTVQVAGAVYVNTAATQWRGVLRVTGAASPCVVCYWRAGAATEVATITFAGQPGVATISITPTPLYYVLSPLNFTSSLAPLSQYQELIVSASFLADGSTGTALSYAQLITADTTVAECNYAPFQSAAAADGVTTITTFPIAVTLSPVTGTTESAGLYQGRLRVASGTYALCMSTTNRVFRTITAARSSGGGGGSSSVSDLVVYNAVPATFTAFPATVMVEQTVTLTFASSADASLAAGDVVQIVDGSLYECGFKNATVLVSGVVAAGSSSSGSTTTTIRLFLPASYVQGGTTVPVAGKSYTICYQRQVGTFATTPLTGGTLDRNFNIRAPVPTRWTSAPQQAQVNAPLTITFYGDSSQPNYLTAADVAFLVSVKDGETPSPTLCTTSAESSSSSGGGAGRVVLTQGTMTKPDAVNTQWAIPVSVLPEGTYVVCYTAANNGEPLYISSPATLVVYPTQSPTGAYLARSAESIANNLQVLQGERVFLLFRTAVALNVVLDNGGSSPAPPATSDVVRVTSDSACSTVLGPGVVDAVPSSFGYAALGLVDPSTGITVPYVHLRVRASVGNYYVCMRRSNRLSWQAYYDFEVVGGLSVNPAVLQVSAAAVSAFTTTPPAPRVWVPHTVVSVTYGGGVTMANMVQFFFVRYTGTGGVTASDEIDHDSCYRPATASQAASSAVTLVNRTLQVYLATPMFTQYSFGVPGTHLLCYQVSGYNIASVYPAALTVANPSPITYAVPTVIAIQNTFTMTFVALDGIFTSDNSNTAQIYTAADAVTMPNCSGAEAPSGGTTRFTTFTAASTVTATVQPRLLASGYFFVCFLTYDQAQYFPVQNAAGGYVFSVGLTGAQRYTVAPSPAYLGQLLHLTITGNQLSSSDHVKVVRVSQTEMSGSDSTTSSGGSYNTQCTSTATNADAGEAAGAAGSTVQSPNGIVADYRPRVNETGTFILCYQSAALANAWVWVTDIHAFTVGPALPTSYSLSVSPPYETEVLYLSIHDGGAAGGRLQSTDAVKLVTRGTGANGFDCTASAETSSAIGLMSYVAGQSSSTVNVYQICGSAVATVTVCYALGGATAALPNWAEVPLQSPPPTYVFAGVSIQANPFVGPLQSGSSGSAVAGWVAPRPYEPFTFYFTSAVTGVAVQRVAFARAPVTVCAVDVSYVTPLLYSKSTSRPSEFTVSLPYAGSYALYLGPQAAATAPYITHGTLLVVGQCDPCAFTPTYALVGGYALLSFPSSVGGSLGNADEVRLFPRSQGLAGRPCDAVTGAYAGVTLTPVAALSTADATVFNVSTGTTEQASTYLGEYYVCYRKTTTVPSGTFAVIAANDGTASLFSIYPADLLTATACPASPMFALETAVFNVTPRSAALYPNVAFSAADVLVVVPTDVLSGLAGGGGCGAITDVGALVTASGGRAQLPTLDVFGAGFSNWYLTFASETATTLYSWCFKLQYDSMFRSISSTSQTVQPENPYEVTTSPPVIIPGSTGVRIQITGSGLLASDQAYIVDSGQSCAETCDRPLTPTDWPGAAHTVQYVNSTTMVVSFSQPINTVVTLGVCYRRTGRYLTRLTNIYVGEPNPISYTVNFVPRVGTRPTLTFTGVNLTSTDAMMIVQPDATCLVRNAVAVGTFLSVSADATTSEFLLALVGTAVIAQSYVVCYQVSTVGAYVEVAPQLQVLDGGPSVLQTSNTPMRGRATVLSVANPMVGDEMYIACVGCSCFDGVEAVLPYGSAHTVAVAKDGSSSSSSGSSSAVVAATIALRVGFNDTLQYPVCYRRSDSGYAQIGGTTSFVTPVQNAPSVLVRRPAAAQYQGQRLSYTFSNYTAAAPLNGGDLVMLVQGSRECWDTPDTHPSGVVVGASPLTGTAVSPGSGEWAAHVPSLGPGVPPDAATLFPLSYALCYRQLTQLEYVSVPYVLETTLMEAADPATFTTQPATVEQGMLQVNMTFAYADVGQTGDTAYVVQFQTLTNTVCDDASSVIVAPRRSAYPVYTLSMSGAAVPGSSNTAVCYIRASATVAEVPQLLTVAQGNPSGYVTNVTSGAEARERQYIEFTILGSGLSAASDAIVFVDVPCASAPQPLTSSAHLARLGDATSTGTEYRVVAQFIAPSSPVSVYVCYRHNSMWREVGAALTLSTAQPLTVTVVSAGGTQTTPRAGQHLYLQLVGGAATAPIGAAVLSGATTGVGTWCHNFTTANVQEPALTITSAAVLDVSVWQVPGYARVCVRNDANTLWADVASSVDAATVYINPPNPLSMDVFPQPPRVGQSVTLQFHLATTASAGDVVRITTVTYEACELAQSIPGFAPSMAVTVVNDTTTSLTLVDTTDALLYRSFNAVGVYRVCYYSATEFSWGVVGGTLAAGSVTVEERVPQSWTIAAGHATIGQEFAIAFHDELGLLQPSAGHDLAWAAPSTVNCGQDPNTCTGCIVFGWNTTLSNSTTAVTTASASVRLDAMNLCYRLAGATAALVPGSLNITTGPIQCVEEASFISGQRQTVVFRLEAGTDVTDDSWRLSFYATTALHCDERYVDSFVPGSAQLQSTTDTSATYSVVWPVGLGVTTDRYTICFSHNGLVGPVCTCGQIDVNTGECFITGTPGAPQSFTPTPQPTYVGQTITLHFTLNESMTAYPPTAIKFVTYVDPLTACDAPAAFTPSGATLTRVSAVAYTYEFKHDYALGSSTLLVCALTDLSTSYGRVASTIVPSSPTTINTLWIRPYIGLTTFPATADYLRAMQTLNLTFTMSSQLSDDLVGVGDTLTVVSDPHNCVESFIASQDPAAVMAMFYLPDTAFLTLPAAVLSANTTLFRTATLATFAANTAGVATHYLCYRLAAGTWAPVLPALSIQAALIDGCSITGALSPTNGDNGGTGAPTNNGGSLRAMYYAPTHVLGTVLFGTLASPAVDAVRVVPQGEWCTNDAAAVFTIGVADAGPSSSTSTVERMAAVFFASLPGTYKLCYRFGTSSNWSPACTSLAVTAPTPTGATAGCWNVGQAVTVTATQALAGYVFTASDRLRLVQGSLPCITSSGSPTTSSDTVTVGDAQQPADGVALTGVTTGQTTYAMAPIFFRSGTTAVRMCYTDAAGNQFAVPMTYASTPAQSLFAIQARQPTSVRLPQQIAQVGQRLFLNFTAASATVTPLLHPYAPLPSPYTPGPAFNGTFDGATLLAISSAVAYTDGRCDVALRAGTLTRASILGVYGAPAQSGGTYVPYTIGNYDPTVAQYYITCYQLATCGVVDSGAPLRVHPSNPSTVYTSVATPRRGQLIDVRFQRDTTSPDAVALTPGSDRGAKQANLASCWTLTDASGRVVQGTADLTYFTTIFHAQAPALAATTVTRSCYKLRDGSWSEVPNGVANVLAANPTHFDTTPTSARVSQVNYLHLYGSGFGSSDRVKLITQSLNCTDASVPPPSFAAYSSGAPTTAITGTSEGWAVTEVSGDGTTATLNFTASATGTFSVCYRLAADTVWTLVYADLTIYERNPAAVTRTPVATLEGELFTLNFTASTQGTSGISASDRVVLYYGASVDCVAPTPEAVAPSVTAPPSRTDLLPQFIAFQLAAGTRGSYTLCYLVAATDVAGGYVPVWGYDVVVVAANPQSVQLYPERASNVHRPNELLTLLFEGWGLVASADKTDAVKLILAGGGGGTGTTDAMCQQNAAAAAVTFYPLYANGTFAEQVWRVSTAGVNTPYAVCYKLNGGQYHVVGDALSITGAASPSGATSPKLGSGGGAALSVGESMLWTLVGANAQSCVADAALLFFSGNDCNDVRYFVNVSALISSGAAAMAAAFPGGAAVVLNCGGATQLRVPSTYPIDAAASSVPLSLCYWSAGNDAVSVLLSNTIALSPGVPPPLSTSLAVTAQVAFSFTLSVTPTTTDWVVLVTDMANCRGITAPANNAYFTDLQYNAATGATTITAAVPEAGMYYVCYAHQQGSCAPSTGRECARVVGVVSASASSPRSWTAQQSPLYVSGTLAVTLAFPSGSDDDVAAQATTALAWLAATAAGAAAAPPPMRDVWVACALSQTTPTAALRRNLTYSSATGVWSLTGLLTHAGRYALCYTAQSTATAPLHLFGPASNAGPVVLASTVAGVHVPPAPTVMTTVTVVLTGGGLSTTDAVVAVAVPAPSPSSAAVEVPGDICTNTAYTPRVASTSPSTPSGTTGLSTMLRNFVFTTTGNYVLCYTPTYSGTTSDIAGGGGGGSTSSSDGSTVATGKATLITATPFTVSPNVVSMTVTSGALEVGVPLDILFTGSGLTASDTAALVYVGGITGPPSAETVCSGSGAVYTAMTSASADGTTATYSTTPTQPGAHMVCFRKSQSSVALLMPERLNVGVRTAVRAVFTVQPGGCAALLACTVQPTVTLLNSSNAATSAPYSTVSAALFLGDGTTAAPAGYLTGDTAYTHVDFTNFSFLALRVSTAGSYVLKATVALPGGSSLIATSTAFTVADDASSIVSVAALSCLPVGLLDRTSGSTANTIDCMIAVTVSNAPGDFTVEVNAGTVGAVTRNGTTSEGLPTYHFLVTAPASSPSTIGLVNYIAIIVAPAAPYERWPVQNSPTTVRLATAAGSRTALGCSAPSNPQLPLSNMVRVGASLSCYVQGVAMVDGQARNIVARPQDLRVTDFYNGDVGTSAAVSIGAYPTDVNGRYTFAVSPSTGVSISVAGLVLASQDASGGGAGTPAWTTMVGSPQEFILIGVATAAASRVTCASMRTESTLWYTPAEPLQCTVTLANAQGAVNGVQSDYAVLLPDGGSVAPTSATAWGPRLVWNVTAPPQPSTSATAETAATARAAVVTLAAAVQSSFGVQVRYTPSTTIIATYSGNLVYVSATVSPTPTLTQGKTVSLTLAGIGLVTTHRYALGAAPGCATVLAEATPTEGSVVGQLVLTFEVPSSVFVICFAPEDARTKLQPVSATQWTPQSGGADNNNRWTADDLVLLIIGVVFLAVLLVLLAILLWCILCGRADKDEYGDDDKAVDEHHRVDLRIAVGAAGERGRHVYMPPRANNRYVLRVTEAPPSPAPLPITASYTPPPPLPAIQTTSPPPTQQQQHQNQQQQQPHQQQQQQQPNSNTQIRINIHESDTGGATAVASRAPQRQPTPEAVPSLVYTNSSSSGDAAAASSPATLRKRHHHRPRSSSSGGSSDLPPPRRQQPQSKSRYVDLDRRAGPAPQQSDSSSYDGASVTESRRSVPPLPPPLPPPPQSSAASVTAPRAPTPSATAGLVQSPRQAGTAPSALPPLPPPPTLPTVSLASTTATAAAVPLASGPYQHLHHTASGPTIPGMVDASATAVGSSHRSPSNDSAAGEELVGPFTVAGHTSKPMVRSASSSRRT